MRVIYDYQIFGAQVFGGISRYFASLATHVAASPGVEAHVVAPVHRNEYLRHAPAGIVHGVYLPPLPRTERLWLHVNQAIFPLAARARDPQVVHETYYAAKPTYGSAIPRVVTVFDMIHELWPDSFPGSDETRETKRRAIQRADHVICISESTRRDLLRLIDLRAERTSVVHLGFDALPTRASLPEIAGVPYLLYVGVRNRYKNFAGMLRAFAGSRHARDMRLVCFGGGTFRPEELSDMHSLGISRDRVVQVGGGDEVLGTLYANAVAFVYPSLYEGFGIPPLEAMGLGCPVIASNTSSIPEVVGDAAEYCEPADATSIAAAIDRVLGSAELRRDLVQKGRIRSSAFSWGECASQTVQIYKELS